MKLAHLSKNNLIILSLITFFFAYETHFYSVFFQILSIFGVFLLFLFNFSNLKRVVGLEKSLIIKLYYLLIVFQIISIFMNSPFDTLLVIEVLRNVFLVFLVIIIPSIPYYFENLAVKFISFFSLVGILFFVSGNSLIWVNEYEGRLASIFFDPNYFGLFCAFAIVVSFRKKSYFFLLINLGALLLSFSKGAFLGLALAFVIPFFIVRLTLQNFRQRMYFILFLLPCLSLLYYYLTSNNLVGFFRVDSGFNGRDGMWYFLIENIISNPLGFGSGRIAEFLLSNGFTNTSSHNFFVDYAFSFGIVPLLIVLYLFALRIYVEIKLIYNQKRYQPSIFILFFVCSNFIVISPIGFSLLSIIYFREIVNASMNNIDSLNYSDRT